MDAFAVSVCKGLAMKRLRFRDAAICGVWFGSFQALMPFVGYLLGSRFEQYIRAVSSWIAFILLALIGANMLREAFSKEEEQGNDSFSFRDWRRERHGEDRRGAEGAGTDARQQLQGEYRLRRLSAAGMAGGPRTSV